MELLQELERLLLAHRKLDGDCWRWTRAKAQGYGVINLRRRMFRTHRVSGMLYLGLDPTDTHLFVCHRCRNRDCFNPAHIYIGTPHDNTLDSVADQTHWFSVKTCCKLGHEYTPENTINEKGRHGKIIRRCRACHKAKTARWRNNVKERVA